MLHTIYVEDTKKWRNVWLDRSNRYGLNSLCYESPEQLLKEIAEPGFTFPRVFVLDFYFDDVQSNLNGGSLAEELRKLGYTGPIVLSSSIDSCPSAFDFSVRKANVLEVVEEYFVELKSTAKKEFSKLDDSELTLPETSYRFFEEHGEVFDTIPKHFKIEIKDDCVYQSITTGINPYDISIGSLIDCVEELGMEYTYDDFRNGLEYFAASEPGITVNWSNPDDRESTELVIEKIYFVSEEGRSLNQEKVGQISDEASEILSQLSAISKGVLA